MVVATTVVRAVVLFEQWLRLVNKVALLRRQKIFVFVISDIDTNGQ
jgi:hypothetical protein